MRAASREVRYGAVGVLSGLAAVMAGRCGGGGCTSCLACAVPGAAVLLLAALGRRTGAAADEGHQLAARQSSQTSMK